MHVEARVLGEPSLYFVMLVRRVIVGDQMDVEIGGGLAVDGLEEVKPLLMAVALGDAGDELAIEIVQGGEQGERTVANIVVGLGLDTDNDTQRVSILPHTRLPVRSSSHRNAPTCLLPFLVGGAIVGLVGFLFIDIRAAPDRALTTLGCDAIGP